MKQSKLLNFKTVPTDGTARKNEFVAALYGALEEKDIYKIGNRYYYLDGCVRKYVPYKEMLDRVCKVHSYIRIGEHFIAAINYR